MAFSSRVEYTGSTSTGPYSFASISLFDDSIVPLQSQVEVSVTGVVQTYTSGAPAAGEYSMDKTLKTVTLGSAPATSDTVKVKRSTDSSAYVDFTNNSPLTAQDLDIATQQALFLAEEGIDSIEAGDAVLALPELTDTDPTMAPDNGDFLRWSDTNSRWEAQSFTPDGTGPDVNIVTSFPESPSAGDLIYHSTYGATYIYDGSSWQYMCGTGAVSTAAPGTTVSELTFGAEGLLSGLTLTSGWTPLVMSSASPAAAANAGSGGGTWQANPSSANATYDRSTGPNATYDFRDAWFATGVTNTSGALGFSNATFDAETTSRFSNANSATDWWGGAGESNAALSATAVLMPRWHKTDIDADTGFTSASSNNNYQSIMWHYPAGIDWAEQSWRTTSTFLQVRPGYNGNNTDTAGGQVWATTLSPFVDRTPGSESITYAGDVNGLLSAHNNQYDDLNDTLGSMFSMGIAPPSSGTSLTTTALIPGPHIGPSSQLTFWSENGAIYGPQLRNNQYLPYSALFDQGETSSSSYTQSTTNGTISDKAIVWKLVNQWDATAKVLTCSVEVDSTGSYNPGGTGPATSYSVTSDAANGDAVKEMLSRQSTDFFFSHGLAGGSLAGYSTGNAPAGLVSIKIETL